MTRSERPERSPMKPALAATLAAATFAALPATAGATDVYTVAKLGYVAPTASIAYAQYSGTKLDPKFYGELGVGANVLFLGLELSAGRMSSTNSTVNLTITSVPVLLAAKLRFPFPVLSPYVEVGGAPVPSSSSSSIRYLGPSGSS